MINWAFDRQLMDQTPFLGRGRGLRLLREDNHRYRRLMGEEETRLLDAAKDDPPMTARVIVAQDTGMRRGEILLLQNKDILLWKEGLMRILAPHAKSRRERRIPISTSRLRAVIEQRAFLGAEAFVLGNEVGERRKNFRKAWLRILADAGITYRQRRLDGDLHWHDLRHECGSRLAERGVPIHEIQYLMGHSALITTQRYLNTTLESLKNSVKVLEQQLGQRECRSSSGHPEPLSR